MPIFEDDCYCDIIWDGERPPALYAMSQHGGVVHIGSFSKSIGPALRVGYIVAPWELMSRMLPLKQDAGSGAIEQMVLAEYCSPHFNERIAELRQGLRRKRDTMKEALNEQFGTAAEFEDTKGGMFLWVKLPDNVDTMKLFQPALAAGVAINPGPEWSVDKAHSKSRMRLCFAGPTHDEIRQGIAALAEVCHREFGVPTRISNVSAASLPAIWWTMIEAHNRGGGRAMASKSLTPEQMETRVRPLQESADLPEAELRRAQHPARRGGEGHRAQGVSGDGAGRLPGPQRRRAGERPARAHRQHRRMRAATTARACTAISTRWRISSASAAASRFHGATRASTRLILEPNDMISVPRGENRKFFNISNEVGRLLVMIVPETDQQVDPIIYAPSLGREIENEYGKQALEGLQTIGFKFEEPVG